MLVRQVVDSKLAQFAYLVGCPRSGEALVIDPERDVDRYFEEAARHNLRIVAAVDTHIHADYLSGLREMAERGVLVYASKEGGPDWQYEWLTGSGYPHRLLADGDRFAIGFIEFRAVHTPGHTPEHLSYLVRDAVRRSTCSSRRLASRRPSGHSSASASIASPDTRRPEHLSLSQNRVDPSFARP